MRHRSGGVHDPAGWFDGLQKYVDKTVRPKSLQRVISAGYGLRGIFLLSFFVRARHMGPPVKPEDDSGQAGGRQKKT
jgi:hypothetical protein